jgi:hypothetical protein
MEQGDKQSVKENEMADRELLAQLKASREAKTRAVAGDTSRFEWDRDKAARIGGSPFYSQPAGYASKDESANQELGDRNNLRGWPQPDVAYNQDVEDRGGLEDKWADGRATRPNALGSDTALSKPGSNREGAGRGYASQQGPTVSHRPAQPAPRMTDNPSGAGRGARRSSGDGVNRKGRAV